MSFTTITVRADVARKLKAAKRAGESFSEMLERLLDNQPARTGGEWLDSIAVLEGRGLFSEETRARLKHDQRAPRRSAVRKRRATS